MFIFKTCIFTNSILHSLDREMKKFIKFLLMAIGWKSYTSENEKNVPDAYKNTTGFFTNYKLDGSATLLVNKDIFAKLGLDPEKFNGYKDLLWPEVNHSHL